jgi:hypothetical protein
MFSGRSPSEEMQERQGGSVHRLQVFHRIQCKLKHRLDDIAAKQGIALSAGVEILRRSTLPHSAHGPVAYLRTLHPAAGAVDHFGRDIRGVVHHLPFFGSLPPEFIIICKRGDPGIAGRAIQATAGDKFFHIMRFKL